MDFDDSGIPGTGRITGAFAMAMLVGALLSGCSRAPEPAEAAAAPPTTDDSTPAAATASPSATTPSTPHQTVGGDGSEIRLDPLTREDLASAQLAGELTCSFSTDEASPILYATGVVASREPAQGVVKVSGYVEPVRAPGGFDGIVDAPTFTGQGKTLHIAVTGPATAGGESPARPATLTYQRADGASRVFEGGWQCGP